MTLPTYSFEIPYGQVNGPLNLVETVLSAQTSEPEWLKEGTFFTDVEVLSGIPVKYTVNQIGDVDTFVLKVQAMPSVWDERIVEDLKKHLEHILGLKDDLNSFYKK